MRSRCRPWPSTRNRRDCSGRIEGPPASVQVRKSGPKGILDVMSAARWPEMHSIGPTMAAVATLAFVLSNAVPAVAGAKDALKSADEVRKKGKRLVEELEALEKARADLLGLFASSSSSDVTAGITKEAEIATDQLHCMRSASSSLRFGDRDACSRNRHERPLRADAREGLPRLARRRYEAASSRRRVQGRDDSHPRWAPRGAARPVGRSAFAIACGSGVCGVGVESAN